MRIQLSDHFTMKRLLLFTMPSIAMMVFTSIGALSLKESKIVIKGSDGKTCMITNVSDSYGIGSFSDLIILSNGENISPEEIENKLALDPLVGEVVVTGENNGLTARIYANQDMARMKDLSGDTLKTALQDVLDGYNKTQPTYRQITGLVVRKNPFLRNAAGKIRRTEVEVDG